MNVYDIETYENDSDVIPYCICFMIESKIYSLYYDENENIVINSLNIIIDSTQKSYIEIYIHNLNFDGMLIINEVSKNKIRYFILAMKTDIYYIEIFYLNKIIKFRCSYKILPLSLRKIGEIENFEKKYFPYKFVNKHNLNYIGEIPHKKYWNDMEYEIFNMHNSDKNFDLKKNTINYCINDIKLTSKFLNKLIEIINNQDMKLIKNAYSAPSISHKLFFKKFNNKVIAEQIYKKDENFIRSSFFGGRTEVYGNQLDNEHVKYYDHSGMYGKCMKQKFHNGEAKYYINADFNLPGFHTIEYISNIDIPILPSKNDNDKLIFCNGHNIGTFWFEEIQLFAKNNGTVIKTINSLIYDKFEYVFSDFIDNFTNIREKGGYYKVFGKLMINSLYGGMALKTDDSITYITFSEKEFLTIIEKMDINFFHKINDTYRINIINNHKSIKFFKKTNNNKKTNDYSSRNVSYASAIAAKGRIELYKTIKSVQKDGGRVLYCDTDSIFACYKKSDKRVRWSDDQWLEFYDDSIFISPKTYALKKENFEEIKIKGINKKNINFEELKKKFYNENDSYLIFEDQLSFKKLNFSLKQLYNIKKISLNTYDKRKFILNKKYTTPLNISHTYR